MKLQGIYDIEKYLMQDPNGDFRLKDDYEKGILSPTSFRDKVNSGTFTGMLVGPSGTGKTTLLRKILSDKNQNVTGLDVDIDGLKPVLEKASIEVSPGNFEKVNLPQEAVMNVLNQSNINDKIKLELISFYMNKRSLNDKKKSYVKDVISEADILENLKEPLYYALTSSNDKDSLAAVTLAYETNPIARDLMDREEGRILTRYCAQSGNGEGESVVIAAPGSACTQKKDLIKTCIDFSTWVNLTMAPGSSEEDRAVAQMVNKPIDRKGMSDRELLRYRAEIFKPLSQLDLPYEVYSEIANYKDFVDAVLSRLPGKAVA